ncbi:hypothetical protein E4U57_007765 [Claviceps arundinis]|nr:hypothetical protein E4U57_007765 [Claviceps arundinis]
MEPQEYWRDRQAVAAEKEKEMVEELKPPVRDFFMQLICHEFEGQPFQSPVLSFCAMLSRTTAHAGHRSKVGAGDDERDDAELQRLNTGGWQEAGNYKSNLSMLIWMAQLLIFESVYHHHVNNVDDTITNQLKKLCEKFLHQAQDTAFARSHIGMAALFDESVEGGRRKQPSALFIRWPGNNLSWHNPWHASESCILLLLQKHLAQLLELVRYGVVDIIGVMVVD